MVNFMLDGGCLGNDGVLGEERRRPMLFESIDEPLLYQKLTTLSLREEVRALCTRPYSEVGDEDMVRCCQSRSDDSSECNVLVASHSPRMHVSYHLT